MNHPENMVRSLHQLFVCSQTDRCWPFGGTQTEKQTRTPSCSGSSFSYKLLSTSFSSSLQPYVRTPPGWTQMTSAGQLLTEHVSTLLPHAEMFCPPTQLAGLFWCLQHGSMHMAALGQIWTVTAQRTFDHSDSERSGPWTHSSCYQRERRWTVGAIWKDLLAVIICFLFYKLFF